MADNERRTRRLAVGTRPIVSVDGEDDQVGHRDNSWHSELHHGDDEYLVRIDYREPFYARRSEHRSHDYHWTYRIRAGSPDMACARAVSLFREMERTSSVGWFREIVSVDIIDGGPLHLS